MGHTHDAQSRLARSPLTRLPQQSRELPNYRVPRSGRHSHGTLGAEPGKKGKRKSLRWAVEIKTQSCRANRSVGNGKSKEQILRTSSRTPFHKLRASGAHGPARSALQPLLQPESLREGNPAPEDKGPTGKPAFADGNHALGRLMCLSDELAFSPQQAPNSGPKSSLAPGGPFGGGGDLTPCLQSGRGNKVWRNGIFLLVGKKNSSKTNTGFLVKQPSA